MTTRRLTTAQAIVAFLRQQHVERDGREQRFFAGCWGIFGHGNVAGIGQALHQDRDPSFPYYLPRNEQAMVHIAAAFAKQSNRLRTFACTTSVGPGATNMLTAAAGATINRLPVLLLPGDVFASRAVNPVLQQLEYQPAGDVSVNDAFRPLSRYWDRIERPEQAIPALLEAMRVLTSPAETGAVTLALPQDVQAEAFEFPEGLFEKRIWHIPRQPPERALLDRTVQLIRASKRPLIVAGGGVIYGEATRALASFVERTGIPIGETQAGKGALPWDHPQNLGAVGATGTLAANRIAAQADLVIGIGTRYSDFTTASKTAFQHPDVGFVNVNAAAFDAGKHSGLPLVADARAALEELATALSGYRVDHGYDAEIGRLRAEWIAESDRLLHLGNRPLPAQSEIIGTVNAAAGPRDVVVCAAGSLPGDLHKLWRPSDPDGKGYHLEYGYSCMGYEIAGGLGVKLADPSREVFVMVGDGSYLLMSSEIATAIQENVKLTIVLIDSGGFFSIGGLSASLGSGGFGTSYRHRDSETGQLSGEPLVVDYASNARSLGADAFEARTVDDLAAALEKARQSDRTTVIVTRGAPDQRVPGYDSWWDVPVAEVSEVAEVQAVRHAYEEQRRSERTFLSGS
jgi:3D-(3,5/4)-trihydroxycyclohexane-1,2-dione acylhydrolase (decyclizing)